MRSLNVLPETTMDEPIRFDDGAAYEGFMGVWSRSVGGVFLDWLGPVHGGRWVDVGCGNGAFTELLLDRVAPAAVEGVDPSEGQLTFARARLAGRAAYFTQGDAMALPFADAAFDAAVMPLVIFFVPDPTAGVGELARVVKPGGSVSAYSWDMLGGGFPYVALQEELAALGTPMAMPPRMDASRVAAMRELWSGAGLVDLRTREIVVERTFDDFDHFWRVALQGPPVAPRVNGLAPADRATLTDRLRARLVPDAQGRITIAARAGAIEGRRPG